MAALVDENQQHKTNREPHAPHHRIRADRQNHRPPGLENHREELDERQDEELELRSELQDQDNDDPQWRDEFLDSVPRRWPARLIITWRQWRRSREISIHRGIDLVASDQRLSRRGLFGFGVEACVDH